MKIYKKLFIIPAIILFIILLGVTAYSLGHGKMEKKMINLTTELNLINTSNIIIEKESFVKENPTQKFIIEEEEKLRKILEVLSSVEKSVICDCRPEYKLIFYKGDKILFETGYQHYSDHYYLRYKIDDTEEQVIPSNEFYNIMQGIINKK